MNETLAMMAQIASQAGALVSRVYRAGFKRTLKADRSPVTDADLRAHDLIVKRLESLDRSIPVLSEESAPPSYTSRKKWKRYWLVDPLDGTREFIDGNGEFTVNIALIEEHRPTMGVVGIPLLNRVYSGDCESNQAWRLDRDLETKISTRAPTPASTSVCFSRSHFGWREHELFEFLRSKYPELEARQVGSSWKLCLVAEGLADLYPKLGPTSEWDTAAADAVLTAAGGTVVDPEGILLRYNAKDSLLNPNFLAIGDPTFPWLDEIPYDMIAEER